MSRIKILPEQVANQIAAGEVVERPASVVKEFVENAIDAGAGHLTIQVEGNGARLIRIVDDGEGMDQDDVLLCLERHATSKIKDQEQLNAIRTLGFRGEAVPSIASVSLLTITSRPESFPLGTRAEIHFGRILKVHEMGCGRGTTMEVRDLFGNLPARRKFLKSTQTELSHIEEVVKNYALALPALGISFWIDDREIFSLPAGSDSLEQRLRRFLGNRSSRPLMMVDNAGEAGPRLKGFLLSPEDAAGAAGLSIFVNGRAVRDRLLGHAVAEGMRSFLMQGRRPAGALFLELPAEDVDVNVHPAKQEVRFRKAQQIHRLVAEAVAKAMALYQQTLKATLFAMPTTPSANLPVPGELRESRTRMQPSLEEFRLAEPGAASSRAPSGDGADLRGGYEADGKIPSWMPTEMNIPDLPEPAHLPPDQTGFPAMECTGGPKVAFWSRPYKLLGQLLNSYILCESAAGLVVIDQHAAHERLLFEDLKKQFQNSRVASQALLFPKIVNLTPEAFEVVVKKQVELLQLGFAVEEFGGGSFVLKSMPALLAHLTPEEALAVIIGRYSLEAGKAGGRLEAVLASMACKAAIKAGQPLEVAEMNGLLQQMRDAGVFSHCPHGRPVMKWFGNDELKKWFHRT